MRARVGHGPVAARLVKRLESMGWKLRGGPYGADGGNRRWAYLDDTTVCWEAHAEHVEHGHYVRLLSYDTMTDCARGCTVDHYDGHMWFVHATNPTKRSHGMPKGRTA